MKENYMDETENRSQVTVDQLVGLFFDEDSVPPLPEGANYGDKPYANIIPEKLDFGPDTIFTDIENLGVVELDERFAVRLTTASGTKYTFQVLEKSVDHNGALVLGTVEPENESNTRYFVGRVEGEFPQPGRGMHLEEYGHSKVLEELREAEYISAEALKARIKRELEADMQRLGVGFMMASDRAVSPSLRGVELRPTDTGKVIRVEVADISK
jgi:hypothetical protein